MNTPLVHTVIWPALVAATAFALPLALTPLLGPDDNGLGTGLLTFAALLVVAGLGGFLSVRSLGFRRAAVLWAVIAAGVALGVAYKIATEDGAFSRDMFVGELGTGTFVGLLVLVPAVVLAAIGHGSRSSDEPRTG